MKKIMLFVACSSLLLSSCDTYTGSGAYAGATFGSILGSAIGGLSGGPKGSDMGTIIGMAGGAAVGAAIGSQADQKSQQQRESVYRDRSHLDPHSYQDGVTSNLYQFIPMTKSLIQLILVMIGFMMKNWGRIMLIHHLWK